MRFDELRSQTLGREDLPVARAVAAWELGPANRGLYWLVRLFRPGTVVETGVRYGFSSASILAALDGNPGASARLFSIDRPMLDPNGAVNLDGRRDRAHVKRAELTGWAVPGPLRSRWSLYLGDARDELVPLLRTLGSIDFFFHDSEHSRDHMLFEYREAWKRLTPGGVLASDDVTWNDAFQGFAASVGRRPRYWPTELQAARRLVGADFPVRGWIVK